ncbi:helix-turn-helix domain-containing protein [Halorussus limi]|uniref:Helix-turn-helix domain-containing protein n=1 Tax=Halorussus limi TaxID=2938695 RepID=A0A8U0HYX2_9EURY|nr:helix-turn-helix domain-containing protein [Halorussus limi]UPV76059.1 helix-turn-helix domain-containing protein [Halorussus limi]
MEGEGSAHVLSGEGEDGGPTTENPVSESGLDRIFTALSDPRRRVVVQYFLNTSDDVATVTDLARYVSDRVEDGFESVVVALHHKDVSKLAEAGIVEYDLRTETVEYVGPPFVAELLDRAERDRGRGPTTAGPGALDHLSDALATDDPAEKDYRIRQALQYVHFESHE